MSTSFIIIIVAILVAQGITIILSLTRISVVKAGDVSETCRKYKFVSKHQIKSLFINGDCISTEGLNKYLVYGNSMSPYGIMDGNIIYVLPTNHAVLESENQYPIVLFKYSTDNDSECDIKLRKFLTFIDIENIDIDNLYKQYGQQHLSLEQFSKDIEERIAEIKKQENVTGKKYILSITYLYKMLPTRFHYSIHNAEKVCGIVKYVA